MIRLMALIALTQEVPAEPPFVEESVAEVILPKLELLCVPTTRGKPSWLVTLSSNKGASWIFMYPMPSGDGIHTLEFRNAITSIASQEGSNVRRLRIQASGQQRGHSYKLTFLFEHDRSSGHQKALRMSSDGVEERYNCVPPPAPSPQPSRPPQ